MPLPNDVDATTPKYLRDKYAIVGVGETTYTRGSGRTTRALGSWAVRNAMLDAGLKPSDIDGMLSYQGGDSTSGTFISGDLGMRLNFYMDVFGGGSSTEALVGLAMELVEAGKRVVLAGLDTTFAGEPFAPMPALMAIADEVVKLSAVCMVCGAPAIHTQRLGTSQQLVMVGATGVYEARCRACFRPEGDVPAAEQLKLPS